MSANSTATLPLLPPRLPRDLVNLGLMTILFAMRARGNNKAMREAL
jgi:hypothetical protein